TASGRLERAGSGAAPAGQVDRSARLLREITRRRAGLPFREAQPRRALRHVPRGPVLCIGELPHLPAGRAWRQAGGGLDSQRPFAGRQGSEVMLLKTLCMCLLLAPVAAFSAGPAPQDAKADAKAEAKPAKPVATKQAGKASD